MSPKPGEVWLADLGLAAKTRPVLIISRFDPDPPRALVIYIPFTRANRGSQYEIPVGRLAFLDEVSFLNVQGIGSISVSRLERKLGCIESPLTDEVKRALRYALDI